MTKVQLQNGKPFNHACIIGEGAFYEFVFVYMLVSLTSRWWSPVVGLKAPSQLFTVHSYTVRMCALHHMHEILLHNVAIKG